MSVRDWVIKGKCLAVIIRVGEAARTLCPTKGKKSILLVALLKKKTLLKTTRLQQPEDHVLGPSLSRARENLRPGPPPSLGSCQGPTWKKKTKKRERERAKKLASSGGRLACREAAWNARSLGERERERRRCYSARMKRLIALGVRVVLLLLSLSGECIGML
jgi:hypothetical protein